MATVDPVIAVRRIALSVTALLKTVLGSEAVLLASASGTTSASAKPASRCVTRTIRHELIHCASILGVTSR